MDERTLATATAFARMLMSINSDCLQFAENIIHNQPSSFSALMSSDTVQCGDDDCDACKRIEGSYVLVAFINSDDKEMMSQLNDRIALIIENQMSERYPTMLQKESEDNRGKMPPPRNFRRRR